MFMMGELTFFLGIQVKQTKQGTFVHQTKYTKDLMKKFNMVKLKPMSTLMSTAMSVRRVPMYALSGFPTLFTSNGRSVNFQVSQTHPRVWDLVFYFFLTGSCWFFFMLILQVVGLTERALLGLVIFLDILSLAGLLKNNLQLPNPPQSLSM
jgi:hypothetical protein